MWWARFLEWRTRTARAPLTLGERAARYGAVACLIGVAIMVIPVMQGLSLARDGAPRPLAQTPWQELRALGWDAAQ